MRSVIFVPNGAAAERAATPGGLSLLERQLKQLRALHASPPVLLVPEDVSVPPPSETLPYGAIIRVAVSTPDVFAALTEVSALLPPAFVFSAADHVVDLRVLRALGEPGGCTVVRDEHGRPLPIGRATAADVRTHGERFVEAAHPLALSVLDPYVPELRGNAAPYAAAVRADERDAAWGLLLDGVQKRTLDLPGQYFDTPFENALVRRLAPTRVTPNQITALTTVVAGITGVLFLHGWLRVGLVLALAVGVLDGVDGKLARLKLATSRIGALEHVTDFFYENFWYLALAAHFASLHGPRLWQAGIFLVACDLLDNLAYVAVRARTGRMLDELSPFDRRFRAVAGRRNVYVMIFAPGFLTGHGGGAFLLAACWAAVTVAVHGARLAAVMREPRPRAAAPVDFQLPEIESASGALVHDK